MTACFPPFVKREVPIPIPAETVGSSDNIRNIGTNHRGIGNSIDKQSSLITSQSIKITNLQNQLNDMKLKMDNGSTVSQTELDFIIDELKSIKQDNEFLNNENTILIDKLEKQAIEISTALTNATKKESESKELRNQLNAANNNNIKLSSKLDKASKKAATASVYKNWVMGLAGLLFLYVVINAAMRYYTPKFG
jgi:chromosome segregation ATPase